MDANTSMAERQREATGTDAEFESSAVPCQVGQEAHGWIDGLWLEQFWPIRLVSRGYLDLDGYHLFHATRADMLRRLGQPAHAVAAYDAAIARTTNRAESAFLEQRRDSLRSSPAG